MAACVVLMMRDGHTVTEDEIVEVLGQGELKGDARRVKQQTRRLLRKMLFSGLIEQETGSWESGSKASIVQVSRRAFVAGVAALGSALANAPVALAKAGWTVASLLGGERIWVDHSGVEHSVPAGITRVAPYGPLAQSLLEAIAPDLIVQVAARGLAASVDNRARDELEGLEFSAYVAGGLSSVAVETRKPDIILDFAFDEAFLNWEIDKQACAPVVHALVAANELPGVCRAIGDLLERRERAEEVADYLEALLLAIAQGKQRVGSEKPKRVYFGEGCCGFSTRGEGTLLDTVITSVGAENAARYMNSSKFKDVDYSLINEAKADIAVIALAIDEDELNQRNVVERTWSRIASATGMGVAYVPAEPCSWLGNSPFLMTTVGALWLGRKVYPEAFPFDLEEEVAAFFRIMYGFAFDKDDVAGILNSGLGKLGEDGDATARASFGSAPDFEIIRVSSLNDMPANLGSGGYDPGPGPSPTTYKYFTYVLVASDSVFELGHAAAVTRQQVKTGGTVTSDLMDLFSFYTDPSNYLSALLLSATDLYNVLYAEEPGTVGHLKRDKTMEEGAFSTSYSWGSFMLDSSVPYGGSFGPIGSGADVYDRLIGVQVSQTKYSAIRNGAIMCVLGSSNAPVSTDYQFVGNNCGDFALGILDECGDIAVNYDITATMTWLNTSKLVIASEMAQSYSPFLSAEAALQVVNGAIQRLISDNQVPTIPNCIYLDYTDISGSYIGVVDRRTI